MRNLIGRTLGHYRIVDKIGEGGMGIVFRAYDEVLERVVAVKVLHEEVAKSHGRLERFEREARAVARLNHPNILAIHGFGNAQGITYAVTEFLEGNTLRRVITPNGLPWQKVVEMGWSIADGLAAAHSNGIIHRDLKPSNIFVTSDGRIKLLDFGLAKVLEPIKADSTSTTVTLFHTAPGTVMGTSGYMSPEQVRGEPANPRSDLFVLGSVFYEMVSGRNPFRKPNPADTAAAILREDPPPLSSEVSDIPRNIERIIHRCLQKEPEARFESAADLAFSLRNHDTELPTNLLERSKRIVVLPFENLGPKSQEYIADGLSDEITTRLSAVSGLHVISRTSAVRYKGHHPPLRTIAEELDVQYVLEGSVRWQRSADGTETVRITPRLIEVQSDSHLWSNFYDEEVDALFDIQSKIAVEVARHLNVKILESEAEVLDARPTENREAYEAFLRGQHHDGMDDVQQIHLAEGLYKRAVELDPGFALAWAYLAEKQLLLYKFHYNRSTEQRDAGRRSAERSLTIDPSLPEGHQALGFFHQVDRNYDKALQEYGLVLADRPDHVRALDGKAAVLRLLGEYEASTELLERALKLAPRDPYVVTSIIDNYLRLGRHKRAEECSDLLISLRPDQIDGFLSKFDVLFSQGRFREARFIFADLPVNAPKMKVALVELEIAERNYEAALERISQTPESIYEDAYGPSASGFRSMHECLCHYFLGNKNGVLETGRRALEITQARSNSYPDDIFLPCELGMIFALVGRPDEALGACESALARVPDKIKNYQRPIIVFEIVPVYSIAGELEKAVDGIEYLMNVPSAMTTGFLKGHPYFDPLRDHPRYLEILEKYHTG